MRREEDVAEIPRRQLRFARSMRARAYTDCTGAWAIPREGGGRRQRSRGAARGIARV